MKAIVIGAGKVGFHIAKKLAEESHDVVLIDVNEDALLPARESLDVMTISGNGASPKTLEDAGITGTNMVIAVTTRDEANIIACLMAKHYGVSTTIARVRNPDYTVSPKALVHGRLGIDYIIHPERLAAQEVVKLLKTPTASEVGFYADGRVEMLGIRCDNPDAQILGKPLYQLGFTNSLVVALVRNGNLLIPGGNTMLQVGDYFYIVGKSGSLERSAVLAGRIPNQVRSVTVVGGGETGLRTCEMLQNYRREGLSVKLIENDPKRAQYLAELLPGILVVNGNGTNIDFLRSEQIGDCDVLIAATGQEEINLLVSMVAKKLGVKEIIVLLGREDFVPLADTIGAHATIIPRLLTAGTILRLIQTEKLVDLAILKQGQAEAMEVVVSGNAPIVGKALKDASLPKGALVGTVIRGPKVIIPHGDTVILSGDRLITFSSALAAPRLKSILGL